MDSIAVKAYAKINLGLDVLKKREDGYHEVRMIMQTLDLHDTITIKKTRGTGIYMKTNLSFLPVDHRNLVYKAAVLFREELQIRNGLQIYIRKRIPVSAGLAGGSSDAAAALVGLNRLFHTGLTNQRLMELGMKLGADVPFCILMGTALSEGIGEILTPLRPIPDCTILLVKPDASISTKYVYDNLELNPGIAHPDISSMLSAIEEGSLMKLAACMDNILQTVTMREYPVITEIKDTMKELGAMASLMSGSGPTVFGIYDDADAAGKAYEHFKNTGYIKQPFLTKPYRPGQGR